MYRLLLVSLLLLMATGCAVSDDPGEGGFIGGVYGVTSGAYDRRIAEREEHLATLRRTRETSVQEQTRLAGEKQDLTAQRIALQAKSDALMQNISALSVNIDQLSANTQQLRQRKQALSQQQQYLQRDLRTLQANIATANNTATLTQYQVEEQRLQQEIKALEESLFLNELR